jgi:beta-aspartyl-peptidase (threonine type)
MNHPSSPAIAVHGGAGSLDDSGTSGLGPDAPREAGVGRAASAAWEVLKAGGSALDAVVLAASLLEDDPTFNAGTGATLTSTGDVELDASLMDGSTLGAGAVACVKDVKNPVLLARAVLERSPHLLIVGDGASAFAREMGIPPWPNERLVIPQQRARFDAARGVKPAAVGGGTIGAVARDRHGHVAAATSTGGTFLKRPGRVGDSPIIGAGTYADDRLAAVSSTGHGEPIIRVTLARLVADLAGSGLDAGEAAAEGIRILGARVAGQGGVIVVGPSGDPGFAFNTPAMARAWSDGSGAIRTALS